MKTRRDHNVGCEIACKIDDILGVANRLLRGNDLTRLQAQVLEKMIADLIELQHLVNQKLANPEKHFRFDILLRILIEKLAELAIHFFDSRG